MSMQISLKKQIVFGLLLLVFFAGIIEIGARVFEVIHPSNCEFLNSDVFEKTDWFIARQICDDMNNLVYEENEIIYLKPNQNFSTLNINSIGFRGAEIEDKDTFSIFVIGGSTVFGVGSTSDDYTIPAILEQQISHKYNLDNFQVINAGIPFADSFRELHLIKNNILELNPDIIIIYDGWNDSVHKRSFEEAIIQKNNDEGIKFKNFPFYRTPFVINSILTETVNEDEIIQKENSEVINNWKNNIMEICRLGKNENFKTVIGIQPIVGLGNKILTEGESKYLDKLNSDSPEIIIGFTKQINDLKNTCDIVIDLTKAFDESDEAIFFDQGHMSNLGNKIIAEKLANSLSPILGSNK